MLGEKEVEAVGLWKVSREGRRQSLVLELTLRLAGSEGPLGLPMHVL